MKKNNKKLKLLSLIFFIIFCLYFQTVVYSALSSNLTITGDAYARVDADVRVTDFSINDASDGALSAYEEFGKNNLETSVTMPYSDSYVVFKVDITNYGNANMGIKDIDGLHSNLSYDLIDYNLKDKLCDENGSCNLGSVSTFYIKIKYNNYESSNTIYSINLNINFEQVYNVSYDGITNNNYPTSIMKGDTLNISFTNQIPKVIPYSNGEKLNNYTYANNSLSVTNVTNDIDVVYKEKVYMTTLPDEQYFKEATHLAKIKKVYFVNYLDEGEHLAEWDLSENSDGTIIGWIDNSTDYNLYIGSDWNIYSKDLSRAFNNMTGLTNIHFENLNTSECTSMYYMFADTSGLVELDLSSFDTKNVTNMARMFKGTTGISELNISHFDTSSLNSIYGMFQYLNIEYLDLSNFDTSRVQSFLELFGNMKNLKSIDLSNFNTTNVTDMSYMFSSCNSLNEIKFGDNFITDNVTNLNYMFYCTNFDILDISFFNTKNVVSMNRMFAHNIKLTNIYVGEGWVIDRVTDSDRMFAECVMLPNYDSNYIDGAKAYVGDGGYLSYPLKTVMIDNVAYEYEQGMTWEEWVNSEYNTINAYINEEYICLGDAMTTLKIQYGNQINKDDTINNSMSYSFTERDGDVN